MYPYVCVHVHVSIHNTYILLKNIYIYLPTNLNQFQMK